MQVSAVVPVYNSAATLGSLVEQLDAVLAEAASDHEIVLVDDGSRDGSWAAIGELTARHPQVVGIRLARNVGEHHALLCGIRAARFGVVVTLDDDLQNPPAEIPLLLGQLEAGHDLVYGVPRRMNQSPVRRAAARVGKGFASAMVRTADAREVSSFRAFRTSLRDAFSDGPSQGIFLDEMLRWGSSNPAFVPVQHLPRAVGRSNYRLSGLVEHTLDMITNYSVRPLRFASAAGALALLAAPCFALAGVATRDDGHLATWLLAALMAVLGGSILVALGIVGEYLGRVFERSTTQPPYVVASVVPAPHEHDVRIFGDVDLERPDATGTPGRASVPGRRS